MTRETIRTQVSEALEDSHNVHFTESDVNTQIQNAYNLVVLLSGCKITSTDVSFVSDRVYYTMSDDVSDFYRALAIFNNNTNKWLTPRSLKQIEVLDAKWEIINAEPTTFIPIGVDTIAFYPHAETATGDFKLYYSAIADTLADDSIPDFYSDLHPVLQHLAVSEHLASIFEFVKAKEQLDLALSMLEDLIERIDRKGMTDRIYQHIMHYGAMD